MDNSRFNEFSHRVISDWVRRGLIMYPGGGKVQPSHLSQKKPLSALESRFTRIAENLEREDKDELA